MAETEAEDVKSRSRSSEVQNFETPEKNISPREKAESASPSQAGKRKPIDTIGCERNNAKSPKIDEETDSDDGDTSFMASYKADEAAGEDKAGFCFSNLNCILLCIFF